MELVSSVSSSCSSSSKAVVDSQPATTCPQQTGLPVASRPIDCDRFYLKRIGPTCAFIPGGANPLLGAPLAGNMHAATEMEEGGRATSSFISVVDSERPELVLLKDVRIKRLASNSDKGSTKTKKRYLDNE